MEICLEVWQSLVSLTMMLFKSMICKYGATPMPLEKQTLRDTSIVEEDGKTIIEFIKLLVEDGENPIFEEGENIFLHARGVGSALGYHTNGRLSFSVDFSATESPTPLPLTSPKVASANSTVSPITLSPSKSPKFRL